MAFRGRKNLHRPPTQTPQIVLHQFLSPLRASSSSSFTVILISVLSCSCLEGSAGTVLLLVPGALDTGSLASSSSSVEEKQQPKELQVQQLYSKTHSWC